jgi:hypothetical protein
MAAGARTAAAATPPAPPADDQNPPAPTDEQAAPEAPEAVEAPTHFNAYPARIAVTLALKDGEDPNAERTRVIVPPGRDIPADVDPVALADLIAIGYAKAKAAS